MAAARWAFGRCRWSAAGLFAARRLVPRLKLGAMRGHLLFEAFLGTRFELGARLSELGQTLLTARQFFWNRHTICIISLVGPFSPRQKFSHFGLQLRLDLDGMLIRKSTVPAGIGVNL